MKSVAAIFFGSIGVAAVAFVACGGGGSSSGAVPGPVTVAAPSPSPSAPGSVQPATPAPVASPTVTPTTQPTTPAPSPTTAAAVTAVPASLSFLALDATAQSVVVRQAGNTGGYTISSGGSTNCAHIVALPARVSANGQIAVSPAGGASGVAGSCAFRATGDGGRGVTITVTVTATAVRVN